jgi:hypothetical protein
MAKTISELVMEFFRNHPLEEFRHRPIVDWVTSEYLKEHDTPPSDIWRETRKLHEHGILIKVKKGVYKYDPDYVKELEQLDFSPKIKEEIFKRDNYRCVVCGRGRQDGVEICADHKKPKDKGGSNTIENGQTLCMEHNLLKKNYSQTEAGKRYFIKIYEDAITQKDEGMIRFCKSIFNIYDEYKVNGHIPRPNGVKK